MGNSKSHKIKLLFQAGLPELRGEKERKHMIKKYVIFKKECGYISTYLYNGTNIRTISKLLDVPYRNIYRYEYLKDLQKWQRLNSDCVNYIIFEGNNRTLRVVNKVSGKTFPLYYFRELEDMIYDFERGIKQ